MDTDSFGSTEPSSSLDDLTVAEKLTLAAVIAVCTAGIIIISAYVCLVFCLTLRHHRRRRRALAVISAQQWPEQDGCAAPTNGLDPDAIGSLSAFVYSSADAERGVIDCSVCLGEFTDGDEGRELPGCGHCFHRECIDVWLAASGTCPLCRSAMGFSKC